MVKSVTDPIIDATRELALAVDEKGTPIEAVFWKFEEEGQRWMLRLASPDVASRGPIAVYGNVRTALESMPWARERRFRTDDIRVVDMDDEDYEEVRNLSLTRKPGGTFAPEPYVILWTYRDKVAPEVALPLFDTNGAATEYALEWYRMTKGLAMAIVTDREKNPVAGQTFGLFSLNHISPLPAKLTQVPTLSITQEAERTALRWEAYDGTKALYLPQKSFVGSISKLSRRMQSLS